MPTAINHLSLCKTDSTAFSHTDIPEGVFTCVRQMEDALIFASVVPQDHLVNTRVRLGDLEFEVKAILVSVRQP